MSGLLLWDLRLTWRNLAQNRLRTVLTVLGIALGVAILLAITLANEMALANFRDSLDRVAGKSNLGIRPVQSAVLDQGLLDRLGWLWRIDGEFAPVIEQTALWPETREVVQVLGLNMVSGFGGRWEELEFRSPPEDPFAVLRPGHGFVGAGLARRHDLQTGETFELYINDRPVPLTVAGVLSEKGLGGAYSGSLVLMDIQNAQALFAMPGQISAVNIKVPPAQVEPALAKLEADLPPDTAPQRSERRGQQVDKMLRAYRYNLTTLSFISLLVGVFLIYNTMSISIIRRRPEIGTMRAIGFARGQIFRLFATEALVMGFIGTLLGLGLGVLLARSAADAVSATVATLYTGQVPEGFSVNPWLLLQAGVFGILMTMLGALAPVLEATGVSPAEAARRASYETRIERYAGRLAGIGLICAVLAGWAALQPPVSDLPVFGFLSALLIILAAALLMPLLLKGALTLLLPVLKAVRGTEGRLAGLFLRGALGRTAVAVASLMIGIAMMVSLAVMIGSFRETVVAWVNQTLQADLWIDPVSRVDSRQTGRIAPETIAQVRQVPGIEAVDVFYEFPIEYNGNPANLGVGDFEVLARYGNLQFIGEEPMADILARAMRRPGVVVTESFANRNRLSAGDTLTLQTPSGPRLFAIEGVYYDYASDLGYVVLPRRWYREFYGDEAVSNIAVFLAPGAETETVRQAILDRLERAGSAGQLVIRSNRELRAEVLRIFDRTFAITYALHIIAIAVALLAVMNSLFALVLEARRDFGILKYLGADSRQVGRTVLTEAFLLGLFGNLSGLGVGFLLSFLLIYVINRQSFGWTIQFSVPVDFLVQSFLLVMGTALLAGLVPARLAARTQAPAVVRAE